MTLSGSRSLFVPIALAGALAIAVLYVILAAPVHAPPPPAVLSRLTLDRTPHKAPAVGFLDGSGRRHALSEFRGRTVLLNLWATWCAPCIRELPALAKLSRAVPARRLTIVAVDVGRDGPDKARAFLAAHDAAALAIYLDSDLSLVRSFRAYGLPLTVLIDPKGREIGHAFGAEDWSSPDAIAYLKRIANSE